MLGFLRHVSVEQKLLGRWRLYSETHMVFQQVDWANSDNCSCEPSALYRTPVVSYAVSIARTDTLARVAKMTSMARLARMGKASKIQRFQQDRGIEVLGCMCE